jgi:hypothetical protein
MSKASIAGGDSTTGAVPKGVDPVLYSLRIASFELTAKPRREDYEELRESMARLSVKLAPVSALTSAVGSWGQVQAALERLRAEHESEGGDRPRPF